VKTKSTAAPDAVPNRFLRAEDWSDPRYSTLRGEINEFYRTTLRGLPHPSHARHPETIVTHWSREWEYPWTVLNARLEHGMSVAASRWAGPRSGARASIAGPASAEFRSPKHLRAADACRGC
jgi:hypothetical protein